MSQRKTNRPRSTNRVIKQQVLHLLSTIEDGLSSDEREFEQIRPVLERQPHSFKTVDSTISRGFRSSGRCASLFFGLPQMALYRQAAKAALAAYSGCQDDVDELKKAPWRRQRRRLAAIKRSIQSPSWQPSACLASLGAIDQELRQRAERLQRVCEAFQDAAAQVEHAKAALASATEQYLQTMGHLFDKLHSPVFPWLAYDFARRTSHPVPPWVSKYLDGVAGTIVAQLGAGNEMTLTLSRGGRGSRNIVNATERALRDLTFAIAVQREIDGGAKRSIAPSLVAKAAGKSEKTIRRAHQCYENIVRAAGASVTSSPIS